MAEALERLRPGTRVGRFLLVEPLGHGVRFANRARAYLALDLEGAARVALQVAAGDARSLATFADGLARARAHPVAGFPPLLMGGADGDRAYVVHPWISGVRLDELCATGPLDRSTAVGLTWALAGALARLHSRGRVHGDLHPRNVRITSKGEVWLVGNMPAPFQVGETTVPDDAEHPRYQAPERATPDSGAAIEPANDIYSLGLMVVELIIGSSLFGRSSRGEYNEAQGRLEMLIESGASVDERLPSELAPVVQGMLRYYPWDRLPDGGRVVDAVMHAWPQVAAHFELPRLLRALLDRAMDRAANRRLAQAQKRLDHRDPLGAAGALTRLGDLDLPGGDERAHTGRELLRRVLWAAAAVQRTSQVSQALAWLSIQAAEALRAPGLAWLARVLLARAGGAGPPLGQGVRAYAEDEARAVLAALERRLGRRPADPDALLALAVWSPDQDGEARGGLDGFRARLLVRHGFPDRAVAFLARGILDPGTGDAALDELERVLSTVPSAPPPRPAMTDRDAELLAPLDEVRDAPRDPVPFLVEAFRVRGEATLEEDGEDPLLAAARLFSRGQELARSERLGEAAQVFSELLATGFREREHYEARIRGEVFHLLWLTLSRRVEGGQPLPLAGSIWELVRHTGLEALLPLCEQMLLASLPEGAEQVTLDDLVSRAPGSVLFRQAAAARAMDRGDERAWAVHLLEASLAMTRRLDLASATKLAAAAETVLGPDAVAEAKKRIRARGLELAEAGNKQPDLLHQAVSALLRDQPGRARALLRRLLEAEPSHDEGLLYLAALDPPTGGQGQKVAALQVEVLRRHGLTRAAFVRARTSLDGGEDDVFLHELLVELCAVLGEDPTPHYFALLMHAAAAEDPRRARTLVEQGFQACADGELLVSLVLESPDLARLVPRGDLMALLES